MERGLESVFWAGLNAWACDLCSHAGPQLRMDPALGLMICLCHLEILNNLFFELVFWKRSPMGQWNICVSRGYTPGGGEQAPVGSGQHWYWAGGLAWAPTWLGSLEHHGAVRGRRGWARICAQIGSSRWVKTSKATVRKGTLHGRDCPIASPQK